MKDVTEVKYFQQDPTIAFFLRNGFTLHVSGDNSTHHQEYNAVYGLSGRQVTQHSAFRETARHNKTVLPTIQHDRQR